MFGLLRPNFQELAPGDRRDFQSAYCNLCASLSAGYGLSSRLLVVFDFASLRWLLEPTGGDYAFPRFNCVRGGTLLRKRALEASPINRFLAAISAFTCGVKTADDLDDQPGVAGRLTQWHFGSAFKRAQDDLLQTGFDVDRLHLLLARQRQLELQNESDFERASAPTGEAYGMVGRHLSSMLDDCIDSDRAAAIGEAVGRCIYLIDAHRDADQDSGVSYNPLLCGCGSDPDGLPARRTELRTYVLEQLQRARLVIAAASPPSADRWQHLEKRMLRLTGMDARSVTLNMICCIPCEAGTAVVDSNECANCCIFCCCVVTCMMTCSK